MRDTSLEYYRGLFRTVAILPRWQPRVGMAVARVLENREMYRRAAAGWRVFVPWQIFALAHAMECDCDPSRQILNGEAWNQKTTLRPAGLGPWPSWEASARDAASRARWPDRDVWTPAWVLKRLEQHNGMGYAKRGAHSPYLWSGCQHGTGAGKFTADGKYDPSAVSAQVGAGVLLWALMARGEQFGPAGQERLPILLDPTGEWIGAEVFAYQEALNAILTAPALETEVAIHFGSEPLKTDGWAGKRTSDATKLITGNYLPGDARRTR